MEGVAIASNRVISKPPAAAAAEPKTSTNASVTSEPDKEPNGVQIQNTTAAAAPAPAPTPASFAVPVASVEMPSGESQPAIVTEGGPPTPPLSSAEDLLAPFSNGGIPWYMEPFDPVGTTICEERWTGREVVRSMSEELSELDDEELRGLVNEDMEGTSSEKLAPTASGGNKDSLAATLAVPPAKRTSARRGGGSRKTRYSRKWR
jgi:NuA3 HAT complex component NTO1